MRVGLIGAGNMARALARGWGDPVLCSDAGSGRAAALAAELGGRAASNIVVAQESDLVVLCHKPYQLDEVAREISEHASAVASVLASTPTSQLSRAFPTAHVFRLMPNVPVEVRQGVTCYAPAAGAGTRPVDPDLERQVLDLFERVGAVVTVEERLLGVAGAVSGVGPAYQALLAEAQVDAAVRRGLKPAVASQLVVGTMAGSAALLEAREHDTLRIRREVTSPAGTTAQGLDALERGGVRAAFSAAMNAVLEVAG